MSRVPNYSKTEAVGLSNLDETVPAIKTVEIECLYHFLLFFLINMINNYFSG